MLFLQLGESHLELFDLVILHLELLHSLLRHGITVFAPHCALQVSLLLLDLFPKLKVELCEIISLV